MKSNKSQKNIPDGWSLLSLESLTPIGEKFGIVDGPFGSNLKTIHYKTEGIPIITSGHVTNGYFNANEYLYVTKEKFEKEKRSSVKGGDIVMAKIGARCGASAILPHDHDAGILSGNALKISIDESRHVTMYIWQVLSWLYVNKKLDSLRSVGAQPALSMASLKKFKLLIPPLPEQQRIIAVLETWDQMIEKLTWKIKIKKKVKSGLMQQLLSGKVRLPGFKDKWKTMLFGDIVKLRKGRHDPKGEKIARFCVELENIQSNTGRIIGNTFADNKSSLKTIFYPGDVLFGKLRAYLKKYWFATREGVCSTEIWALESDKQKILPEVLFQIVQTERFIARATMSQGTHMPRSNWDIVSSFEITLPDLDEQALIADIFVKAEREIEVLEKKLSILKDQRKYLLNNLITGNIRTPENLLIVKR